jgi:hypothetical protein
VKELGVKPTVVIPDTAPLIHLAAADALSILNAMGRVVIPDVVASEATYFEDKPYASEVAGWIARGQQPRSNQPVEIAQTDIGALYRLALDQNLRRPRNAGEIGIAAWLADNLAHIGGPALVIYENGRVPGMLSREGVAAVVALAITRNLLTMAQENGIIENAEAVWQRIMAAVPTANPASVLTIINPGDP